MLLFVNCVLEENVLNKILNLSIMYIFIFCLNYLFNN